jgi:hypothetical protein
MTVMAVNSLVMLAIGSGKEEFSANLTSLDKQSTQSIALAFTPGRESFFISLGVAENTALFKILGVTDRPSLGGALLSTWPFGRSSTDAFRELVETVKGFRSPVRIVNGDIGGGIDRDRRSKGVLDFGDFLASA